MTTAESTRETDAAPRVWVGCLAAYNAGTLHGEWVEADDAETLQAGVDRVLKSSPIPNAEEFAFMDREGFGDMIGEYSPVETVAALGAALVEHGEAFMFYCENAGATDGDAAELVAEFEEAYCGYFGGLWSDGGPEYAEQLAEELGAVPADAAWPQTCIDWERAWNELTHDGYWERGGHVFRAV